ncbi:GNAT family N-acetyltransferase [Nocardioides sp.]|uniref:GNAT family N-acetyltransferase n=1 Tax=Nocardioides sp. TaxID=35761 RepID=UPI00260AC35F|nr:GNAT family N-acetyltransferase [Nocardioides sp.]
MLRFEVDALTHPAVIALLNEHLEDMYATSPAESVHALDLSALQAPEIAFWSAWEGVELRATGAIKTLGHGQVELKSMRTVAAVRGQGVGASMLAHLLEQARRAGAAEVLLETGTEDYFAPARRLYARHGFVECPPFAAYVEDPNSVFMVLALS